ncbi:MAG: hypothetical protein CSA34_04730 [Desulfobulbus propionicus]|nr:MAG: hypothetical protein CSA34_04730 [Desulfobulbus propionicus]
MNKKNLVFCCLVLCVFAVIYVVYPGDKKQIRTHLESLAVCGSSTVAEPMLETVKKVKRAAKLCPAPFRVTFNAMEIDRDFSQKEFTDHFVMLKKKTAGTTFTFTDVSVVLGDDDTAEVQATLLLEGKSRGDRFTDAYETLLTAEKKEGGWRFSSVKIVEFMQQ